MDRRRHDHFRGYFSKFNILGFGMYKHFLFNLCTGNIFFWLKFRLCAALCIHIFPILAVASDNMHGHRHFVSCRIVTLAEGA